MGMSERFVFEEDYGWPAKIMRSVIWSATAGVLWSVPWIAFVVVGRFYFDFVESRMPIADRAYDGFGMGIVFYGVFYCLIFSFFLGVCVGFFDGMWAKPETPFGPSHSPLIRCSFGWVVGIIFVMLVGAGAAFLREIVPMPGN